MHEHANRLLFAIADGEPTPQHCVGHEVSQQRWWQATSVMASTCRLGFCIYCTCPCQANITVMLLGPSIRGDFHVTAAASSSTHEGAH
jgi:hypothetical protein